MKRIAVSVLTIGVVLVAVFAVTRTFFSDTETNSNTLAAGTIDISVDGANPWSTEEPGAIEDMKPSYVRWTRHVVRNVGDNPVRVWKHIKDVTRNNNGWSESECSDANGVWTEPDECTGYNTNRNNIDEYIEYDMYVGGSVIGEGANSGNNWLGGHNEGGTVVVHEDDGITVRDIESVFVDLGTINPERQIVVWQSYHMKDETGNWAQTDRLSYTIEFYAEQVNGNGPISGGAGPQTLLLENKVEGVWDPLNGDGTWGVLKWAGDGNTFDFSATLEAHGLTPSTSYSLIYYADGWPGNISANPNLGIDMPDPADANHPTGAKIWLVLSSDYDSGSKSMTAWNPNEYLFEYNLIKYDDTDN
jgi:hypothetical protein